jgi:large subunit ribosomal protein L25
MAATLDAIKRETRGKNEAIRLRAAGKIPGIVYGGQGDAIAVAVDPKALSKILHSGSGVNTLIGLNIPGEAETRVLVKEYQLEPVQHSLLHADFYRIAMDKAITVTVSISVKGEPRGVKLQGGVLDFPHREVEVECLPADIPDHLEIDVTELMIGEGVHLRDLATGAKWTPVSDPDTLLVHVVPPRTEEAATAEAAAPVAEPEVIKKGKTDEKEEDAKKK